MKSDVLSHHEDQASETETMRELWSCLHKPPIQISGSVFVTYSTPARLFQYCEAGEQWRPAATPPDRSSSLAPTIVRRRVRSFLCVQRSRLPDRGRSCPS